MVVPCMEVGGFGAGTGGEGVVKPSRVPLGVVLAAAMPHTSQFFFTSIHW